MKELPFMIGIANARFAAAEKIHARGIFSMCGESH